MNNNTNEPINPAQQPAADSPEAQQDFQSPATTPPEVQQDFQQPAAAPVDAPQVTYQPLADMSPPVVPDAQAVPPIADAPPAQQPFTQTPVQPIQQPAVAPEGTYQNFQQPVPATYQQQPQQQPAGFAPYVPQEKKGIPTWGIVAICAAVFFVLTTCTVVTGFIFFRSFADTSSVTSITIDDDRDDFDIDSFDASPNPDVVAQISQEFFDAEVDIQDPDREEVPPTVYRGTDESVFTDDFFNISITVPNDETQQNIHEIGDSYYWSGFSWNNDFSVDVRRMESSGSRPWWGSAQEEVKRHAVSTWRESTIVDSGVLTINGEDYVFVRHYSAEWPDSHSIDLGRSINGILFTISIHTFDLSRTTESFFE